MAAGSPGGPAGRDLPFLFLIFTAYAKQVFLDNSRRAGNAGSLTDQQVAAVAEAVADPAGVLPALLRQRSMIISVGIGSSKDKDR